MARTATKLEETAARPDHDGEAVAALDAAERELIEIFADLSVALGLPRSLGQIYGFAYAATAPICFDDVVHRLELSKGSASQGLRVLRELGALREAQSSASPAVRGLGRTAGDEPQALAREAQSTELTGKGDEVRGKREAASAARIGGGSSLPLAAYPLAPGASGADRREYFVPETSVRALLGAVMRQRIQPPLTSGAARLERLTALLREAPGSGKSKAVRAKRLWSRRASAAPDAEPLALPSSLLPAAKSASAASRSAHLRQRVHSLETWHRKARAFLPFLLKLAG